MRRWWGHGNSIWRRGRGGGGGGRGRRHRQRVWGRNQRVGAWGPTVCSALWEVEPGQQRRCFPGSSAEGELLRGVHSEAEFDGAASEGVVEDEARVDKMPCGIPHVEHQLWGVVEWRS
jgi:hypothetical protein